MQSDRRRRPRASHPMRWALVVLTFAIAASSCGGGGEPGDAGGGVDPARTDTSSEPIEVAPLPPVQPTAATSVSTTVPTSPATSPSTVASTSAPATSAASTTTSTTSAPVATSAPATTGAPAPPCEIGRIVAETGTDYEAITAEDLRCAGVWASWIGRPDDQFADGFFAVAFWTDASWELANLGTAGICADAGVPDDLWDRLGCFE